MCVGLAKPMSNAAENILSVRAAMNEAARRADRKADDICLIAVSKTYDAAAIAPVIAAGQRQPNGPRSKQTRPMWCCTS
jgi:PLP dependent protein